MHALLILSPFVLVPVAAWLGSRGPRWAALLAVWPAALALIFASTLSSVGEGPRITTTAWAPSLGLSLSFNLDGLGLLFALLITGIGTLVVLYAAAYLAHHRFAGRFYATLFAFMGSMLGVVLADNIFALFVFWELTSFTSFLLIGFEFERREARAAALQALLTTGAGGMALFGGVAMLGQISGTHSLAALVSSAAIIQAHPLYVVATCLVLLAAFTKSAQVPFHFWLPSAMAAPTPVSAYLHSATMVKAGVYLLLRMTPILGGTPFWTTTVTVVGATTLAGGAWRAVQQTDLKRVLAYSTVSALGALVLMIGIGTHEAIVAALVYLVAHACYKGTLFMVAGAIEHETGTRDVTALGGLGHAMPKTAAAAALAAASMVGLPLFVGFYGKELFYDAVLHHDRWSIVLAFVAVAASALLGVAGLTAGVAPFAGARRASHAQVHEPAIGLWLGPLILGILGVVFALLPVTISGVLAVAAASVTQQPMAIRLTLWHGVTPMLLLSLLTIGAAFAMHAGRSTFRTLGWPRSLGTARLYTGVLRGLDGVSAAVSPSLDSGSLRSYVLVLILTTGALVGTALFMGGGGWTFARITEVRLHEAMVALTICAGAISAATASSSMTAVISLGAVGYGVALTFMFFGAPDLAMTQFSVETLTVVIFVLVFRHFGAFDSLTSNLVRWRDAIVATAFGALVGTLTLLVGASGTASRLSDYFVEAGPRLAHGRNIVNVILVDFRAFDTLGEITVLVTAAIGVHALLRLGVGRRDRP